MRNPVLLALLALVLSGCAGRYCEREVQIYENVVERAPLQSPEGLQVPEPDPNFEIPEASGDDVAYATPEPNASGRVNTRCLDTPPRLAVAGPAIDDVEPVVETEPEQAETESEPAIQDEESFEDGPEQEPVQL